MKGEDNVIENMCEVMIIMWIMKSKLNEKYGHGRNSEKFTGLVVIGLPEMGY